jgi:hypothetical protein
MIATFENMQNEAFRIQKDMYIRIKDFELLDLDEDQIRKILKNAGVSRKVRTNLINGVFTPINFSKKRFDTKVNTIERELDKLTTEKRQFSLNEDFVYPKEELKEVINEYRGKEFFEEEYDPEKFQYKLNKNGRIMFDEEGDPIRVDETFIDKAIDFIPPSIKESFNVLTNPLGAKLPPTPMPNIQNNMMAKNPITGLTRTESALLSPEEQVIARRT